MAVFTETSHAGDSNEQTSRRALQAANETFSQVMNLKIYNMGFYSCNLETTSGFQTHHFQESFNSVERKSGAAGRRAESPEPLSTISSA